MTPTHHGARDQRSEADRAADARLGPEGLSEAEADARLAPYGPNAIVARERGVVLELLSHFWAPIPGSSATNATGAYSYGWLFDGRPSASATSRTLRLR